MSQDSSAQDPYLWLEDVHGERAMAWVKERNAITRARLQAHPRFEGIRSSIRAVLDSKEKIPAIKRRGAHVYNFWEDAQHPRGLWRRTSLAEYRKPNPAWELLLDVGELGRKEGVNWVYKGAQCLGPHYQRCLLSLSRGGADAVEVREFDLERKTFMANGFKLPEAKTDVEWLDENAVFVATDFGPGTLTASGYPRTVKLWQRGTPLSQAHTVFEAKPDDVGAFVSVDRTPGHERVQVGRWLDFYNSESHLLQGKALQALPKPRDASLSFVREHVLLELRSDWATPQATWPKGSLLVADAKAYLAGTPQFHALFTPTASRSLAGWTSTRHTLLLNVLEHVASRVEEHRSQAGTWQRREVAAPYPGTISLQSLHDELVAQDELQEQYLLSYTDFLTPDSLYLAATGSDERSLLKSRPAFFNSDGMRVEQRFASSKDGTRVPYFVVWPKGAKADGRNPTLLYGYGGFENSMQPWYSGGFGTAWYRHGGVLVVANIRGGGEYGPAWHQAAVKHKRQRSFDDFAAVAEDLLRTGVTSAAQLGIEGGSNGGLLVGAVMLQRPELFNAVVCQVPLLDMQRYHKLLAGASWMAEYGNPDDPADWAAISRYSPYHNVKAGQKLPTVLFTTSTRDDRVHPGHARKMAARMLEQSHSVLYHENIEGGHAGAADNAQRADMMALEFSFLWQQLAP